MMTMMVSYNIACKKKNPTFYENVEMVRMNTPWYSIEDLECALQEVKQEKFIDVNLKLRTKDKIADHDFKDILKLAGKYNVEWVGISNIEDTETYDKVRKILDNESTKICAKVETKKGCENIEEIINKYDGIMIDVEDLASEIGWKEASKEKQHIYSLCEMNKKTHFRLSGVIFECLKYNHKKIVFSFGAYDLLHPGHLRFLETAKSYGDVLVIGVVGDKAIKDLKGEDRPIFPQEDRMRMLNALSCVDVVLPQETYDPTDLLEKINPDILIKGDDWDYIPGEEWIREHGKILVKPKYNEGWSTSGTVKKIRGK